MPLRSWNLLAIALIVCWQGSALAKKLQCQSKELKLQNCEIKLDEAEYSISSTSVRIFDGTWRGVVDLPKTEKVTEWENLKLRSLGDRKILIWKVWREEDSAPKLDLESLHWVLLEIKGIKMNLLLDKIIQKRRRKSPEAEEQPSRFLKGTLEAHRLYLQDEDLKWKVAHQEGEI